jgi:hypothetical protein
MFLLYTLIIIIIIKNKHQIYATISKNWYYTMIQVHIVVVVVQTTVVEVISKQVNLVVVSIQDLLFNNNEKNNK